MPRIPFVSCLVAICAVVGGCSSGGTGTGSTTSGGNGGGSTGSYSCTPHCVPHSSCILDAGVPMCQCKPGYDFCPDGDGGLACVDEQTDSDNCSACGKACTPPFNCSKGACPCVLSLTVADCGGECADLTSDPKHCGGCQPLDVCGADQTCVSMDGGLGSCQCSDSSLTGCPSGCVDLTSDPFNCGCCGNTCLPGDAGGLLMCLVDNGGSCQCPGTMQECGTVANPTCGLCTDTNW